MIEIHRATEPAQWQTARSLVLDLAGWLRETSGIDMAETQASFSNEVDDLAATYAPPRGCFLLADFDGVAIGSVAVRMHDDGRAELKRMYVRPGARGRGAAQKLLKAAVTEAVQAGASAIWLETGEGIMDTAIALYERNGFVTVDPDGYSVDHPAAITMERSLRRTGGDRGLKRGVTTERQTRYGRITSRSAADTLTDPILQGALRETQVRRIPYEPHPKFARSGGTLRRALRRL